MEGLDVLECELETAAVNEGEYGLSFTLANRGDRPVEVRYFAPFVDFDLSAYVDDQEVRIVQPAFDTGLQPVQVGIAPGESVRIPTPIRLRFDADPPPSGGDTPTLWTLVHAPAPVVLRATARLPSGAVAPCVARLDPG